MVVENQPPHPPYWKYFARCLQKGVVFESKQAWRRCAVVKMDLGGIKFVGFCIFHSFLHPIRRGFFYVLCIFMMPASRLRL